MAPVPPRSLLPVLLSFLAVSFPFLPLPTARADPAADLVAELEALRAQSPLGVIHLDDRAVSRFLASATSPRPYSLVVFFDAAQLRSKPELHLPQLLSEFGLVSAAFATHHSSDPASLSRVFFCDIEFGESQQSFALFGVSSLPHVRHVGPAARNLKDSEQMQQSDFSRLAESMAEFVEAKTGLPVGPIERPPAISGRQMVLMAAAVLVSAPFLIRRVLLGDTFVHDRKIWMAGAVSVYFFSVSGTMHNIIRKMPLVLTDREDPSRLMFFYQGSGMQLGAEGFAIGSLYTVVGLMLALVTRGLVHVRNPTVQRALILVAMLVSFWAVKKVVYLDNWKTGYSVHAYWPNTDQHRSILSPAQRGQPLEARSCPSRTSFSKACVLDLILRQPLDGLQDDHSVAAVAGEGNDNVAGITT
ncbi:hypothetical protein Taro_051932 [Colocasia esculenta]|uniref:Dolichyl-diphosphooligosaccharide--protein glycosyltransferase subunit 3B n=1 Tax=Colocasia esculenta TaxID=4460 RepID=A0A843XH90_COLES|nr:hypothetical protein [Colocasia esculenta]